MGGVRWQDFGGHLKVEPVGLAEALVWFGKERPKTPAGDGLGRWVKGGAIF